MYAIYTVGTGGRKKTPKDVSAESKFGFSTHKMGIKMKLWGNNSNSNYITHAVVRLSVSCDSTRATFQVPDKLCEVWGKQGSSRYLFGW